MILMECKIQILNNSQESLLAKFISVEENQKKEVKLFTFPDEIVKIDKNVIKRVEQNLSIMNLWPSNTSYNQYVYTNYTQNL